MIPANTMDTENVWKIKVENKPAFYAGSSALKYPTDIHLRMEPPAPGEKPSRACMTVSYMEQGTASHIMMAEWRERIERERTKKLFSTRAHKRGATLIYHTGIVDVEIEFKSLRAARIHGKKHAIECVITH